MNLFRRKPKRSDLEILQDDHLTDSEKIDEYARNHGGDKKATKEDKEAARKVLELYEGNTW